MKYTNVKIDYKTTGRLIKTRIDVKRTVLFLSSNDLLIY